MLKLNFINGEANIVHLVIHTMQIHKKDAMTTANFLFITMALISNINYVFYALFLVRAVQ